MSADVRDLALRVTRGGASDFFDLLDEYVVCDNRGFPRPDTAEVVFGRDRVIDQYVRWWGTFENYSVEAEDVVRTGKTVAVVIKEAGRGKNSAIPFRAEHTQVWTFRDARIVHIELYRERGDALEAAGLSPSRGN